MRRKRIIAGIVLGLCTIVPVWTQNTTVTMQSLLRDIVNREKMAEYPDVIKHRTLQASSYNRASVSPDQPGWFADSDGVFCVRTEQNAKGETEWVLMEDNGPGAITKIWAVCFYYGMDNTTGADIKIYLDGEKEPVIYTNFFDLVRGRAFVKPPLAAETRRAGNSYLPIPYARSCKVTMNKKVFYNIINYHSYPEGTKVKTFSMEDYLQSAALVDSVNKVLIQGTASALAAKVKMQNTVIKALEPGTSRTVSLAKGSRSVQQLTVRLSAGDVTQALRSTVMKVSFDGEPAIWTPVGDFFNVGVGLKTYSMWERSVASNGTMTCRWVMPYRKDAVIEFENLGKQPVDVEMSAATAPYKWTGNTMYFHSSWRMDDPTPGFPLFDYNLLEVDGRGMYVGDQFTVLNPEQGWWGEGDEKVYVDNDQFPSHFGTGTEDYYGWAGGVVPNPVDEFDEPFLSNVRVAAPNSMGYNTCTRTRVLDAIPFNEKLNFNIESSGSNRTSWFHLQYALNTYWYACPGAKNNRKPLPEMAARKITTLEELQAFNEKCKANRYVCPGAIEAENLDTYKIDAGVESCKDIKIWGELSNGAVKAFTCNNTEQGIEVHLTELFTKVPLKVCLITGKEGGEFEIWVNNHPVRTVNLAAEYSAASTLDLGTYEPADNALNIRFVSKTKGMLGIDYFLIQ